MVTLNNFNRALAVFKESADMGKLEQEAQVSVALPSEAQIDKVSKTLEAVCDQILALDQERNALGLPEEFLKDELVYMEILRSNMTNYFEGRTKYFSEISQNLEAELVNNPQSSQSSLVEPSTPFFSQPITGVDDFINRDEAAQLFRLEKIRDLPPALVAHEALVDDYNSICDQIAQLIDLHDRLEKYIENSRKSITKYVSDLKEDLGLIEGREYSDVFRFYKIGTQIKDLDSIERDEPSQKQLEAINTQAATALSAVETSNRLETIEAYIRIQTFYTYSEYIDQHYINGKSNQNRFDLKVEIAKALDIGSYFYANTCDSFREMNIGEKVYELQIAEDKAKYAKQFGSLIKNDSLKQALNEKINNLVEALHNKKLIVETVSGGWRSYTPKETKYLEKAGLDFSGTDKRSTFKVSSSKDTHEQIDKFIFNFVLQLRSGADRILEDSDVKSIIPFHEQADELFKKSTKSKTLNKTLNSTESSLIKRLKATASTTWGFEGAIGGTLDLDRSISNYNTFTSCVQTFKNQEQNLKGTIKFFTDRLCSELKLDKMDANFSVSKKLMEVAKVLQKPLKSLAGEISAKRNSYIKDYQSLSNKSTVGSDQIRKFFVALIRQNLKPQYKKLEVRRAELIQAIREKPFQVDFSQLNTIDFMLRDLEDKKLALASHIYDLYRLLYDAKLDGSIAFEIEKAKAALKEGWAPEAEIKELELAIEELASFSYLISPSLIANIKQNVTALKTQALLRNVQVAAIASSQVEKFDSQLVGVKDAYESLELVKVNSSSNELVAVQSQAILDKSLTEALRITASKDILDRRIIDLGAPLSFDTAFDPQFLDGSQLDQLGQSINPSLQIWVDAHRMQEGITNALTREFDALANRPDSALGLSLRGSPVNSVSSTEEENDLTDDVIDSAINALHDVEYFSLDLEAEDLPTPSSALIPNLFKGNLFAKFTESKIASFLVNAYQSAVNVLKREYKDELLALDSSAAQEKMDLIANFKACAEKIKLTVPEYIENKLEKERIKKVVAGLNLLKSQSCDIQLKIDSIERKKSLLQRTLSNADIILDDESLAYTQTKLASLEENKKELLTGLIGKAKQLGLEISSQANIVQVQSFIDEDVQTLQTKINKVEEEKSPTDQYAELHKTKILPLEQEIKAFEEEIRAESSATYEDVGVDLSVLLRDRKAAYLDLSNKIHRRAILASFKVFGLSCSRQSLDQLIELSARMRKEVEETT